MNVVDRFLRYVKYDTQSDELTNMTPSTPGQMTFAKYLADELRQMGLDDITLDDNGYLMATLPANTDAEGIPTIGFIAHLDTSPDMSGHNVTPRIVENYDGGDILLNKHTGITLSPNDFPELLNYKGQALIVTDGNTLLGADDKAGIAEIISAVGHLQQHPEIKHGKIRIAFNPDEEIGQGAHKFDVQLFGADWAYTMDGGEIGELEYENFNAAVARVTFTGRNVHPGYAKHKMINSMRIANQFVIMLPRWETPEHTEGYEGFYHLIGMEGTVEKQCSHTSYETTTATASNAAKRDGTPRTQNQPRISRLLRHRNQRPVLQHARKIEPLMHIIDTAEQAMRDSGVTPKVVPIRGGTDGAQLSFKGLPCPNIFAGGLNFHGRYEYIPIPSMEKATEVIVQIARIVAQNHR